MHSIFWVILVISFILSCIIFFRNNFLFSWCYKKTIVWWSVLTMIGMALLYVSWNQYTLWKVSAPGLLPPHLSITYFISYVGFRIWAPYLISLGFACVCWMCMKFLNKKYEEKFFYEEELLMASLALFLVGYPALFFYIVLFFCIFVFGSIVQTLRKGIEGRMSMRFFWIPLALCVILLSELYFSHVSLWGLLKI